jgi:hypothetical protein
MNSNSQVLYCIYEQQLSSAVLHLWTATLKCCPAFMNSNSQVLSCIYEQQLSSGVLHLWTATLKCCPFWSTFRDETSQCLAWPTQIFCSFIFTYKLNQGKSWKRAIKWKVEIKK